MKAGGRDLLKAVAGFVDRHRMFVAGDTLVAGVSGGADSMAMLDMLRRLAPERGWQLEAFHMNHQLRGAASDGDEALVAAYCKEHGITCHLVAEDVAASASALGIGLEEAGRILRHRHLKELAERLPQGKAVLAHHLDDQAETVLHHVLRGTSLKGLGGMEPIAGKACRPLLEVPKEALAGYCSSYGVPYREDESNTDNRFTRNRIRNILLPLIEREFNPNIAARLAGMAELVREEEALLSKMAADLLDRALIHEEESLAALDAGVLSSAPAVLMQRALRMAVERLAGSLRDMGRVHTRQLAELLGKETGKQVQLPGGMTARRSYGRIEILNRIEGPGREKLREQVLIQAGDEPEEGVWKQIRTGGGTRIAWRVIPPSEAGAIPKNKYTKWFDYDRIVGNLTVRARKDGDFLRIGPSLSKKKIKEIFIDSKVPRQQRDAVPLLADEKEVLWVVGYRMSDQYKITGTATRVLEVVVGKEEQHVGKSQSTDF